MHGNRVWEQWVGPDTLTLWHPDGRTAVHRFSYRLYPEVVAHNWSDAAGYAMTRLSKEEGNQSLHALALGLLPGRIADLHVDHIDGDTRNSRDWNLRVGSKRSNDHNKHTHKSSLGTCIQNNHGGYRVTVRFHGPVYTPTFKTLDLAVKCREVYLAIAGEYDAGLRDRPSREELKSIANALRT